MPNVPTSGVNFWKDIFPTLVSAGGTAVGSYLIARGEGKSADITSEAGLKAAELQTQTARESLDLARQIYNQDVGLNWPAYVTSTGALKKLAFGSGVKVPESTFVVPEKPPALGGFTPPGTTLPAGFPEGGGDLSQALLAADAGPGGSNLPRTISGIGMGAALGSFTGPVGAAVGAGIGAGVAQFGKGRREANKIVPYQEALDREITAVGNWLKSKEAAGTLTQEDWAAAYNRVKPLRDQFYGLTAGFGRAGPQAQRAVTSWYDPTIENWGQNAGILTPNRYIVGEAGPEILEMAPGSEGWVYPNPEPGMEDLRPRKAGGPVGGRDKVHKVMSEFARGTLRSSSGRKVTSRKQAIAIAMSEAGMERRQAGGPVGNPYGLTGEAANLPTRLQYLASTGQTFTPEEIEKARVADLIEKGYQANFDVWTDPQRAAIQEASQFAVFGAPGSPDIAKAANLWAGIQPGLINQPKPGGFTPPTVTPQPPPATTAPPTIGGFTPPPATITPGTLPTYGQPPSTTQQSPNIEKIKAAGWKDVGGGQWMGPGGDVGYFMPDGRFLNTSLGKVWDPFKDQIYNWTGGDGSALPPNPYADMQPPYDVYEGEFMQPWQGGFGFDPTAAGFQPFNRPFEFNAEDLYKDPGYAFRLSEGQKAIERSQAARGLLQSGPTLKALTHFGQGTAAQEYAKAYGRSLGEFGLGYQQTADAYQRAQSEYNLAYNEFLENQLKRRNWLAAMAGLSAEGGS